MPHSSAVIAGMVFIGAATALAPQGFVLLQKPGVTIVSQGGVVPPPAPPAPPSPPPAPVIGGQQAPPTPAPQVTATEPLPLALTGLGMLLASRWRRRR